MDAQEKEDRYFLSQSDPSRAKHCRHRSGDPDCDCYEEEEDEDPFGIAPEDCFSED